MSSREKYQLSFEDMPRRSEEIPPVADKPYSPDEPEILLFDKLLVRKKHLREILRLLGSTVGKRGLIIGGDAVLHHKLSLQPGTWESLAWSKTMLPSYQSFLKKDISVMEDDCLPFEDGRFDIIIVVDGLQRLEEADGFIKECHRGLKSAGSLILHVPHLKRWSLLPLLKELLDVTDEENPEFLRRGYRESEMFNMLRDGFDVEASHTYSRFFLESTDIIIRYLAGYILNRDDEPDDELTNEAFQSKAYRYFSITYPLLWLASALDSLLFFTKGYSQVIRGKRRIWRPRRAIRMHDGRSLAEAALTGKIGTAAEM